ncbi:MAG: lipase family protein [Gallionella sp.]|nr:lipase family protein [Gallionella sp.]
MATKFELDCALMAGDKLFAPTQATAFTDPANGYSFISYKPNDWTGFSATVFKSNSAANDYTIAVRGTEPTFLQNLTGAIADLLNTDAISVSLQGAAYEQVISAYRYYKQLVTPPGTQVSYSQAEKDKLCELYRGSFTVLLDNPVTSGTLDVAVNIFRSDLENQTLPENIGLGGITDPAATIHFTGHSLGGHVATLLASLVQQSGTGNVADITTYNAPGESGLLGVNPAISAAIVASKITNIVGEGGIDVTAGLGQMFGATQNVFIEEGVLVANHSIVKLTDSLAVYNLLAKLDSTLNSDPDGLTIITDILKAESSVAANSLESAVSAFGKLFGVANGVRGLDITVYRTPLIGLFTVEQRL